MHPTLQNEDDVMSVGGRRKFIHSVGVVAKIKWIAKPKQPYSGLFEGGDFGLLRFSTGGPYDTSMLARDTFTPSLAIKMLRNGTISGNLVAMFSVDGVPTWNPFGQVMSNHIPAAESECSVKVKMH